MNGSSSNTSGEEVAIVDATDDPNGTIPFVKMQEIARRLVVTVPSPSDGSIIYSPTEPEDKTKVWWQTDPISGVPIGQPKTYNQETGQWETYTDEPEQVVLPKRRTGKLFVAAGGSVANISFADMGSVGYVPQLTPTTQAADGTFQVPQIADVSTFVITNMASNQLTVQFYAVPVGGLTYLWSVTENEPA